MIPVESRKKATPLSEVDSTFLNSPAVPPRAKNPRRVAAGRRNWAKRNGFTPEGLARLRAAALQNKPWTRSTGPRTAAGKAISAGNRWRNRKGGSLPRELRSLRRALVDSSGEMRRSIQKFLAQVSEQEPAA